MNGSKELYEKLIRSSPLFKFDKIKEPTAYKREAIKLVEYLYCYLLSINENKYIEFGLEITETARRCINNYNEENGDFLSYFNAAWAKEYRRAFGKRQAEQFRCGMHITEDDQLLVLKYLRFIEKHSKAYDESKIIPVIAEALEVSCDKVRDIIKLNNTVFISSDSYNDDDESASLFDFIGEEIDDNAKYEAEELLAVIEKEFLLLQTRQRELISKLITLRITESLSESEWLYDIAKQYTFFDGETYNLFARGLVNARIIAKQCGVSEQSASRSLKVFLEHINR